jgi:hypothetical protein
VYDKTQEGWKVSDKTCGMAARVREAFKTKIEYLKKNDPKNELIYWYE